MTQFAHDRRPTTWALAMERHDHVLLCHLAQGWNDDVVARRLGISERTLRRRLRAAFDRIGARSRFQAGFLFCQSLHAPRPGATTGGDPARPPAEGAETGCGAS